MNARIKAPMLAGLALLGMTPEATTLASTVPVAAFVSSEDPKLAPKCPPNECGRNSATVEQFPLPALDLDGGTFDGFQIVGAETSNRRFVPGQAKYRLEVNRFGELVASNRGRSELITSVTVLRGGQYPTQFRIKFQDPTVVRTWARGPGCNYEDGPASDFNADCYEVAYDVFWQTLDGSIDTPVCQNRGTWGFKGTTFKPKPTVQRSGKPSARRRAPQDVVTHPHMLGTYTITPWDEPTRRSVLVEGEVYDLEQVTVHPNVKGRRLNIACAGSAIGKMKLMGYDPTETRPGWTTSWEQRQATLKMLTARYCAAANDQVFTKNGQAISFQNQAEWMSPWPKAKLFDSQVEAKWDMHGATCLTLPRSSEWHSAKKLEFIRETCGRNGKPLPKCPDFLPPFGSTSKRSIPSKKGSVAHPVRPRKGRRSAGPSLSGSVIPNPNTDPTLPKIVNSKKAQSDAEASFEGQLSSRNEWMTFNRWP